MPQWLENQAEGYAKHLGADPGSKRHDRIKYGTMRAKGWKPKREQHKYMGQGAA